MDGTALARRIVEDTAQRAAVLTSAPVPRPVSRDRAGRRGPGVRDVRPHEAEPVPQAGIESRHVALPAATTTAELVGTLRRLSADPGVHGILLQHPVGDHVDERAAFEAIAPEKDVDGVTSASFATMSFDCRASSPAPPAAFCGCWTSTAWTRPGKRAVVVAAARSSASRWACCWRGTPR